MSKISFDDVKKDIESSGWHLLSTTYSNLKADLEVQCPEKHICHVSYQKWRNGHFKCPICKNNPLFEVSENVPKKKGYRVLAFDQASGTSGWSVYDNQELISYGHHTCDGAHNTIKIAKTKYWAASMIEKWKPDFVVLEDIQLQSYKKSNSEKVEAVVVFKKLAHLQGVLKNYIYEIGLPYSVVPAATWKNFSSIKGSTRTDQKRNAQLKVKSLYDISVSQDEADAILIGRWAAHTQQNNLIIDFGGENP